MTVILEQAYKQCHVGKGYIGSPKSSLLGRQACNILGLIRRVSVDTAEPAEIFKNDHPKLYDSLENIPVQYEMKLRTDSQPFAITTRPV